MSKREWWEDQLEAAFEDLIKNVPIEHNPPFMPILLEVRKIVSQARLKERERCMEKTIHITENVIFHKEGEKFGRGIKERVIRMSRLPQAQLKTKK